MARPTIINRFGTLIGWNNITINILGRDLEGIEEIKYSDEETQDVAYGAGKFPIGKTKGNYKATASVKLYLEELLSLQKQLPQGSRLQDIPDFDVTVSYEYNGTIYTDVIRNCSFKTNPRESKNNEGKIVCDMELCPISIDWNQ
jgi:hypothetical protein